MDRGVFKAILLAVVLVGLVILTVAIYFPFLVALLWGAVLVTATYPIHRRLVARVGGRRTLAASLMTLGILVCILLPFALIAPRFISQARTFASEGVAEVEAVVSRKIEEEGSVAHRVNGWLQENFEDIDPAKLLAPTRTALTIARNAVEAIFGTLATLFSMPDASASRMRWIVSPGAPPPASRSSTRPSR